jgi:type I pantothenate kinase
VPADPDGTLTPLTGLIRARRTSGGRRGATVVAVDGAVAVGKSTISDTIAATLGLPPDALSVKVVSSDGFIFPNRVLEARGLAMHKGFPDSYDHDALEAFVVSVRSGARELRVPVYSHETYDVLDAPDVFDAPDVLVLEGLHTTRLASLVDVSVYVDADEADIERWYTERFLQLTEAGTGFYAQFSSMSPEALVAFADQVWSEINAPNLHQHILPNRELAEVVVRKGPDHRVVDVSMRDRARRAVQGEE